MGLKEIKQAGENATLLSDAAQAMLSISNTYAGKYDTLNEAITTKYGVDMGSLTNAQVNEFFFAGRATDAEVTEAQAILKSWHTSISALKTAAMSLPVNNI